MRAQPGAASTDDDLLDLPFDQYSRHRIVQLVGDSIRRVHGPSALRVLDVGGYPCLTPRFLTGDEVTVVDVVEPSARADAPSSVGSKPAYICADGASLPFGTKMFDLVVSLDSLEHVAKDRREAYVSELIRVSRGYVLLVAPFAQDVTVLAEQMVSAFVRVVNQEEQPQLREHREYGLPDLDDWTSFASELGLAHVSFSSGFVYNWLPMMLLKHYVLSLPNSDELHHSIDRFYNVTLRESDAREPGYRQGMVISTVGPSGVLEEMAETLAPSGRADRFEVIERMEQLGLLLKLSDLHVASRRDDRLRDELLAKERHILNLEVELRQAKERQQTDQADLEALRSQVANLQQHLADVRSGRVMRVLDAISQARRPHPRPLPEGEGRSGHGR